MVSAKSFIAPRLASGLSEVQPERDGHRNALPYRQPAE
jgi:hypothetical protein